MRRVLVCATALALVAGGSQAAIFSDVPPQVAHHSQQPTFSGEWSAEELGLPVAEESATEVFEVAGRKGNRKRSGRGGSGGFKNGNRRNDNRRGGRDVDINRDVDIDVDHHDHDAGAALVGGVIGIGVGMAIANSNDPDYVCADENADGECDY